jgi:hypothetical protein
MEISHSRALTKVSPPHLVHVGLHPRLGHDALEIISHLGHHVPADVVGALEDLLPFGGSDWIGLDWIGLDWLVKMVGAAATTHLASLPPPKQSRATMLNRPQPTHLHVATPPPSIGHVPLSSATALRGGSPPAPPGPRSSEEPMPPAVLKPPALVGAFVIVGRVVAFRRCFVGCFLCSACGVKLRHTGCKQETTQHATPTRLLRRRARRVVGRGAVVGV